MRKARMKGLSIGVVHPDNSVELASLGTRSERGDSMTTDVSYALLHAKPRLNPFLVDYDGHRILLEGFSDGLGWHPHRRLCERG